MSTPNLGLDLLSQQQVLPHITINEFLIVIDILLQSRILDRDLSDPDDATETDGYAYIVDSTLISLDAASTSGNTFTHNSNDVTTTFVAGFKFDVTAGDNAGTWTVVSSTFSTNTVITVAETVVSTDATGDIIYALGDWNDHINDITYYYNNAWNFLVPKSGWEVRLVDEGIWVNWNGTTWTTSSTPSSHTHPLSEISDVTDSASSLILLNHAVGEGTTSARDALTGLSAGDLFFNTTTSRWNMYDGTNWGELMLGY